MSLLLLVSCVTGSQRSGPTAAPTAVERPCHLRLLPSKKPHEVEGRWTTAGLDAFAAWSHDVAKQLWPENVTAEADPILSNVTVVNKFSAPVDMAQPRTRLLKAILDDGKATVLLPEDAETLRNAEPPPGKNAPKNASHDHDVACQIRLTDGPADEGQATVAVILTFTQMRNAEILWTGDTTFVVCRADKAEPY